jgi:hypothetical protein
MTRLISRWISEASRNEVTALELALFEIKLFGIRFSKKDEYTARS